MGGSSLRSQGTFSAWRTNCDYILVLSAPMWGWWFQHCLLVVQRKKNHAWLCDDIPTLFGEIHKAPEVATLCEASHVTVNQRFHQGLPSALELQKRNNTMPSISIDTKVCVLVSSWESWFFSGFECIVCASIKHPCAGGHVFGTNFGFGGVFVVS